MKWIKTTFLLLLFLGLVLLNIATLISDRFHAYAFTALSTALGGSVLTAKMLENSPTVKRRSDVAVATKVLTDRNRILINNNSKLKRSHKKISAKHNKLKAVFIKKAKFAQDFSKRIATRSAVGAARNITSLPGQAIPLIGTGLIIGVSTWDIYDYCENLKDINKLNDVFGHQLENNKQKKVCGIKVPTKQQVLAEMKENWQEAYRIAAYQINHAGEVIVEYDPPELPRSRIMEKFGNIIESFKD